MTEPANEPKNEHADQPANQPANQPVSQPLNPGDEAAPGTPGSGEDVCPVCRGSGKAEDGESCATCGGTGAIQEGIGGG